MPLGEFIGRHPDESIGESSAFARTVIPPGSELTEADLRDHGKGVLATITGDLAG